MNGKICRLLAGLFLWAIVAPVSADPGRYIQVEIVGTVVAVFESAEASANYITIDPFEHGELTPAVIQIEDESGNVQYIHFEKKASRHTKIGQEIFGMSMVIDQAHIPTSGKQYRFTVNKTDGSPLQLISIQEAKPSNQAARTKQIDYLIRHVQLELDEMHAQRFTDGDGLLYQMTPTYQRLIECCTDQELREIHDEIVPAAPYVAASWRNRVRSELTPSLLESEVNSLFGPSKAPFSPLYVELGGQGFVPFADPAQPVD